MTGTTKRAWRWVVVPALVVVAACDTMATEPDAYDETKCRVSAELAASVTTNSNEVDLVPALEHAAGPMTRVLGEGQLTEELRESIELLASGDGYALRDTQCRLLLIATTALDRMPDTPETSPDRAGIQLVLGLLAHAVGTEP
jgi:hypothetical protein